MGVSICLQNRDLLGKSVKLRLLDSAFHCNQSIQLPVVIPQSRDFKEFPECSEGWVILLD